MPSFSRSRQAHVGWPTAPVIERSASARKDFRRKKIATESLLKSRPEVSVRETLSSRTLGRWQGPRATAILTARIMVVRTQRLQRYFSDEKV